MRVNSYQAMLEATRCGQGIAVLGEPAVRGAGELVRLEIDAELPRVPLYLVYHRDARRVPRIRLVAQALADTVREGLR
jgi:DNA-binding transcriptional LysR family regulator